MLEFVYFIVSLQILNNVSSVLYDFYTSVYLYVSVWYWLLILSYIILISDATMAVIMFWFCWNIFPMKIGHISLRIPNNSINFVDLSWLKLIDCRLPFSHSENALFSMNAYLITLEAVSDLPSDRYTVLMIEMFLFNTSRTRFAFGNRLLSMFSSEYWWS